MTSTTAAEPGAGDQPELRVSVVVPVDGEGGASSLRACLDGLAALRPPADETVVVLDGGAAAAVTDLAPPGAVVLCSPERRGPAAARNLGASVATGDVLLFVDADVVVHPGAVGCVRARLSAERSVDAVIGSYDTRAPAENVLSQYKNLLAHYVHQHARTEGSTFWGACGAIRRSSFTRLGGFDESYAVPSVEDIELGLRLVEAGGRVVVARDLQATHLKRWDARSLLVSDVFRRAVPWSELILRRRRFQDDLNISRANRAKVALTLLALTLLGTAAPAAGLVRQAALAAAGAAGLAVVALDWRLLRFFASQRGVAFALQAACWHTFSYLYSGLAFALVAARHVGAARARSALRR